MHIHDSRTRTSHVLTKRTRRLYCVEWTQYSICPKRSAICNRSFPGPTRVLNTNGISIAFEFSVWPTHRLTDHSLIMCPSHWHTDRQTDTQTTLRATYVTVGRIYALHVGNAASDGIWTLFFISTAWRCVLLCHSYIQYLVLDTGSNVEDVNCWTATQVSCVHLSYKNSCCLC